jgi:hypothetical protein
MFKSAPARRQIADIQPEMMTISCDLEMSTASRNLAH